MANNFHPDEENNNRDESINNYIDLFIDYENSLPSLQEALYQMFKSSNLNEEKCNQLIKEILDKCKMVIDKNFEEIKKKYNKITKNDAYIICAYTCEARDIQYSPSRILNRNLISSNRRNGIQSISKYLYIFLKSLRKLTRYYSINPNNYLYRAIPLKVQIKEDPFNENFVPYKKGNEKIFWGFTSAVSNQKESYNFLGGHGEKKSGTLFILGGDIWGYDITFFNYFGEEEIILEPERKYILDNVSPPLNDIITVSCKIVTTPLILE